MKNLKAISLVFISIFKMSVYYQYTNNIYMHCENQGTASLLMIYLISLVLRGLIFCGE